MFTPRMRKALLSLVSRVGYVFSGRACGVFYAWTEVWASLQEGTASLASSALCQRPAPATEAPRAPPASSGLRPCPGPSPRVRRALGAAESSLFRVLLTSARRGSRRRGRVLSPSPRQAGPRAAVSSPCDALRAEAVLRVSKGLQWAGWSPREAPGLGFSPGSRQAGSRGSRGRIRPGEASRFGESSARFSSPLRASGSLSFWPSGPSCPYSASPSSCPSSPSSGPRPCRPCPSSPPSSCRAASPPGGEASPAAPATASSSSGGRAARRAGPRGPSWRDRGRGAAWARPTGLSEDQLTGRRTSSRLSCAKGASLSHSEARPTSRGSGSRRSSSCKASRGSSLEGNQPSDLQRNTSEKRKHKTKLKLKHKDGDIEFHFVRLFLFSLRM